MEWVVESLATSIGNSVGWLAESGVLFLLFAVIWLAFAAGIVWSHGSLAAAWDAVRGLPVVVQLVAWVLLLPAMAGLWVWQTSWPLFVRLLVVVSVAGWSLLVLLPRSVQGRT